MQVFALGSSIFLTKLLYSGNERFYRENVMPFMQRLIPDGETAHSLAVKFMKWGLVPKNAMQITEASQVDLFGLHFKHRVGIAAGFDKQGEAVMGLLKSGFSFVEVGTVTPEPQLGNPRPRVFRWKEKEAVINRYGFNSDGHEAVYQRLKSRPWEGKGIVGVNLGCNKASTDPIADFVAGVKKFGDVADYLVINVSSPNTPGLRSMQRKELLEQLLTKVLEARSKLTKHTPILLKISPDESDESLRDIIQTVLNPQTHVDGLIVSNTALATYEQAKACHAAPNNADKEPTVWGGLSGPPLRDRSTTCLKKVSVMTQGKIPIVGVGGISSGEDAVEKLKAGATLVQLYSALIYQGPPVVHRVARGIEQYLTHRDPRTVQKFD